MGEKDVIVDNNAAREWHTKTKSKTKENKLMVGAFHELSKETNNKDYFLTILRFFAKREGEGVTAFGALDPKSMKFV
jgi:alpha-beta hydrolase superfamily lysophospholipase